MLAGVHGYMTGLKKTRTMVRWSQDKAAAPIS